MNHENSEGIITDSREIINQSEDQNRDELEDESESEYICSVCQNKAEINTIECEGCQEWFHAGCVDLSLGNMKAFGSLKGKARWFCKTCDERVKKSFQKVEKSSRDRKESNQENQIASYLENMDVQIDTIDCTTSEAIKYIDKRTKNMFEAYEHNFMEILDVFKRDLTDLENKIDEQSNNSLANKMNKLHDELAELKGKLNAKVYTNDDILEKNGDNLGPNGPNNMSRKGSKEGSEKEHISGDREKERNLILYNVAESESGDINKRIQQDTEIMLDILYYLDIKNIEIHKVRRIGKKRENPDQPRPLVVELKSAGQKWAILKQGKFLKNSEHFYAIYLARDMNKDELRKDAELRHELLTRRNNNESVEIKNGQVIRKRKSSQLGDYTHSRTEMRGH